MQQTLKPLRIIFARHGSYYEINLNEDGIDQAQELGNILIEDNVHQNNPIIISSPISRALQTANILAKKIKCSVSENNILEESSGLDSKEYFSFMQKLPNENRDVILVTHMPIFITIARIFNANVNYSPSCCGVIGYEIKNIYEWSKFDQHTVTSAERFILNRVHIK